MRAGLGYVWRYKYIYLVPILAMFVSVGLDMFNLSLQKIIDQVILGGRHGLLFPCWLALNHSGQGTLRLSPGLSFNSTGAKVAVDISNDLFAHIQKLPFSYFDEVNTGEIMSRTTEDVQTIWNTISFAVRSFLEQILYFVTATVLLLMTEWRLALIALTIMPVLLMLALKLEAKIHRAFEKLSDQKAVLNTVAQENIAGVRVVKAFGRENYEIEKFSRETKGDYNRNLSVAGIWANTIRPLNFCPIWLWLS